MNISYLMIGIVLMAWHQVMKLCHLFWVLKVKEMLLFCQYECVCKYDYVFRKFKTMCMSM